MCPQNYDYSVINTDRHGKGYGRSQSHSTAGGGPGAGVRAAGSWVQFLMGTRLSLWPPVAVTPRSFMAKALGASAHGLR